MTLRVPTADSQSCGRRLNASERGRVEDIYAGIAGQGIARIATASDSRPDTDGCSVDHRRLHRALNRRLRRERDVASSHRAGRHCNLWRMVDPPDDKSGGGRRPPFSRIVASVARTLEHRHAGCGNLLLGAGLEHVLDHVGCKPLARGGSGRCIAAPFRRGARQRLVQMGAPGGSTRGRQGHGRVACAGRGSRVLSLSHRPARPVYPPRAGVCSHLHRCGRQAAAVTGCELGRHAGGRGGGAGGARRVNGTRASRTSERCNTRRRAAVLGI